MGIAKKHQPVNPVRNLFLPFRKYAISNGVKLIIGFIFKEETILNKAEIVLGRHFGKIDFASGILPFAHTNYYAPEFGVNLKRKFISFKNFILPQGLSKIKIMTNKIEKKLSVQGRRLVNIDPGYVDLAKLILASTKDYKQRIYLNKGIYAEVALFYQGNTFKSWEWAYPDYRTAAYIALFNRIREIYAGQLKNS